MGGTILPSSVRPRSRQALSNHEDGLVEDSKTVPPLEVGKRNGSAGASPFYKVAGEARPRKFVRVKLELGN